MSAETNAAALDAIVPRDPADEVDFALWCDQELAAAREDLVAAVDRAEALVALQLEIRRASAGTRGVMTVNAFFAHGLPELTLASRRAAADRVVGGVGPTDDEPDREEDQGGT